MGHTEFSEWGLFLIYFSLTVYNKICFGFVKETSLRDISFMRPKRMFDK